MSAEFLKQLGINTPQSDAEFFRQSLGIPDVKMFPYSQPKKGGVQPSQGWKDSVTARESAKRTGRQLPPNGPTTAYYGPGGAGDGSGIGQAQRDTTKPAAPKPAATPAGRSNQSTKTNALGVTQTGTNTGAINMPGLADADLSGIANFNGPSFPTQQETNKITDGYSFTASEFLTDPKNDDGSAFEVPGVSGGMADSSKFAANGPGFNAANYKEGAAGDVTGLDGFKPGGKFAGAPTATEGLSAATSDSSGLRYDASKYKGNIGEDGPSPMDYAQSGEEMRRRSAFLDAKDSMSGMQNVAAGLGMGNQGLRNFANVDGKAVEMSSDKRREILNAAPGEAQALKDKWVKALSNDSADEPQTASSAQNPTQPSGTSTFNEDRKENLQSAGKAVDYMNNNADDDFSINNGRKLNKEAFGMTGATNQDFNNNDVGKFYLQ